MKVVAQLAQHDKFSWRWLLLLAVVFIGVFAGTRHYLANDIVDGDSMQPTLESGQRLLSVKQVQPKRFDIIVLNAPDKTNQLYIKRVIGMPGDTIKVTNDQLYINGHKQNEPYLHTAFAKRSLKHYAVADFTGNFSLATLKATDSTKVPAHHYFVMGDNRLISHDGRAFGFISDAQVESVVVCRYWPLSTWHKF